MTLFASCLASCSTTDADTALASQVDQLLDPLAAAKEFSGAVVLARRGQVVYQRGVGMANHAAGVAFTPDTSADGGSIAKTFTAAGVWWLAHEGKIELDAPVTRYVPEFPHAETTVRHLVTHSNGLPPYYEYFDAHFAKDDVRTTQALLSVVAQHAATPSFPPGSRFEYSNLGFDVAALLIERVTGQRYEQFLHERFFARLGMRNSFARPARLADWPGVRTLGYRWHAAAWQPFDVFDMEAFLGASNLYFSALDLTKWASANAAGTALPAAVFSAGQARSRIGGHVSPITGLSWYCDATETRCYYTGSINAFHSFAYWDRKRDEAAVFMSNSTLPPWRVIALQRALVDALAGHDSASTLDSETAVAFERFDASTRAAVAGVYSAGGEGSVTVSNVSEGLRMRIDAGLEFDVFQVSADIFYVPGPDFWLAFSGQQRPVAMHIRSMFVDTVALRTANR